MAYTKSDAFWYRPDTPGTNDAEYIGSNRFWYRNPASGTLVDGYEYVANPTLRIHRINLELLTPTPPPPTLRIHRMNLELLMDYVPMDRRRPKFFTFLID